MRVKNPHPKRANARTLLKVVKGRREEEEVEEEEPVLCLKIPDEREEMRKEKTATKRGKRKRGHECDVCEKVFQHPSDLT